MKIEAASFIEQARIMLARAEVMLTVSLNEDAARAAYLASFHVAQAYTFERTGKVSKSHRGVQTEFFRLTKDDPRVDGDLRRFLSRSYDFKSVADYSTGPAPFAAFAEQRRASCRATEFATVFRATLAVVAFLGQHGRTDGQRHLAVRLINDEGTE